MPHLLIISRNITDQNNVVYDVIDSFDLKSQTILRFDNFDK